MYATYPRMMSDYEHRSVKQDLSYIALEASVLSNMVNVIKDIFPDMLNNLKAAFTSTATLPVIDVKMTSEHKFIVKEIKAFPFTEYGSLSVDVPEGFVGGYIAYMRELIHATDNLKELTDKIIKPYYVYLSVFLSNKDAKKSTHNNDRFYKEVANKREQLNKDIAKFFHSTSSTSKLSINKLIHNSNEIKELFEYVSLLKTSIDKVDLSEITKSSKQCLDLLNIVIEQIKEGNITNVTPEITSNLSTGAYEIARELEMFSVVYFRILTAITGVDNLAVRLDKFIKNID